MICYQLTLCVRLGSSNNSNVTNREGGSVLCCIMPVASFSLLTNSCSVQIINPFFYGRTVISVESRLHSLFTRGVAGRFINGKVNCRGAGKLAALDAEIVAAHVRQAVGMCSRYCGLFYLRRRRGSSGQFRSTHSNWM